MLRQLVLRRNLGVKEKALEEIKLREQKIEVTEKELATEIEEREEITDEEQEVIETKIEEIEAEKAELLEKKSKLEEEINQINEELNSLNEKISNTEENRNALTDKTEDRSKKIKERDFRGGYMKLERREQIRRILQKEENMRFFENISNLMTRAVEATTFTGKELLLPEEVMAFIDQEIYGYGEVVKLVNTVNLKGKARVIVNGGTPKLFWTEKCEPLKEATIGTLEQIELDNFKLGGYVFLCKAFVEDAIIDVASYVMKEFAQAIAAALDEAILKGKGTAEKQPEGIITKLTADSSDDIEVKSILQLLGVVGGLNPKSKNVTLVVNRATYYSRILTETYGKDTNGNLVYGLGQTLPDGTKVVISEVLEKDQFVLGDFKKYILGKRKEMTFDTSDQVRWIEEQIGYKTSGRYDGKVVDSSYFVKGTFADKEVAL